MGGLNGIRVVQDLTLLHQLKKAAICTMYALNGVLEENAINEIYGRLPEFDLRQTEFFPAFMSSSLDECLNSFGDVNGQIIRNCIRYLDSFLFYSYDIPDPRKDRRQGSLYLRGLNFEELLDADDMATVFRTLLRQSAKCLNNSFGQPDFSVVCEKTPENVANIDVISMVAQGTGYRFLHLVRDPVSVYGARRQRVDSGVEAFVQFFLRFSEPSQSLHDATAFSCIRYEDLIQEPQIVIERALKELDLSRILSVPEGFQDQINPGKYVNYVGSSIDKSRDAANRQLVTSEERGFIYRSLEAFSEKYGYGHYS